MNTSNLITEYFLLPLSPVLAIITSAILLILLQSVRKPALTPFIRLVGMLGPIASIFCTWNIYQHWPISFSTLGLAGSPIWLAEFANSYHLDPMSLAWYWGIGVFSFFSLIFIHSHFRDAEEMGEVLILVHFVTAGMMLLVSANSLLMVFTALELLSLPTYVLVGMERREHNGSEAALKYFLFGSFATVLLLFSIALLYAQTGTLDLTQNAALLTTALKQNSSSNLLVLASSALFIISIGFKLGIAPFHMWLPDAYTGAPTAITGFMGSTIKLAGFGLALRVWWQMLLPISQHWSGIMGVLAVVTMFVGNLGAIRQKDLKRLFAYSSISHAGYLFLGLTSLKAGSIPPSSQSIYYYLIIYGFMFIGTFGILGLIENHTKSTDISKISGLGFSHPVLGFCLAVFALSAAGIPPTAGFLAKYFLFLDAVHAGHTHLVVWAVISSAIGIYYYLRIVVALYMTEAPQRLALPPRDRVVFIGIVACAICLFYFAIWPYRLGV